MKMRTHTIVATFVILAVAGTTQTAWSNNGSLTERSVRAVVEAHQAAIKARDVQKTASYLSDDCHIRITYPKGFKGYKDARVVTMTRQQDIEEKYKALAKAKVLGLDFQDESTTPTITIENGKAHARLRKTGRTIWGGKTLVMVADVNETLEARNGRVLITGTDETVLNVSINGQITYGTSSALSPTN